MMPFTVVVTRNAPARTRGFLASVMLEIAPGVYVSPRMTTGVRRRVWGVMIEWSVLLPSDGGILMTFFDKSAPAEHAILSLGFPRADLLDVDGLWLARRDARDQDGDPEASGIPRPPDPAPPVQGGPAGQTGGIQPRPSG